MTPASLYSPTSRVLGWLWIGFALLNIADLLWRGGGYGSWVAGGVLVCTIALAAVVALRPRVVIERAGLRIVNPLRVVEVPWAALTGVDVTDVLRIHTRDRVFRSWALRETKRAHVRANLRHAAGAGAPPENEDPRDLRPAPLAAKRIRDAAATWATPSETVEHGGAAAPAREDPGASAPAGAEPAVAWSPVALAALGVPAAALLALLTMT